MADYLQSMNVIVSTETTCAGLCTRSDYDCAFPDCARFELHLNSEADATLLAEELTRLGKTVENCPGKF